MIEHIITPEVAEAWGITVAKNGERTELVSIDPTVRLVVHKAAVTTDTNGVVHTEIKEVTEKVEDLEVEGLDRYLLMTGF